MKKEKKKRFYCSDQCCEVLLYLQYGIKVVRFIVFSNILIDLNSRDLINFSVSMSCWNRILLRH